MSSRSTIASPGEMSGCSGGEPRVRPVWLRIARLSSLPGRILGRGPLCRRTEREPLFRAMTGATHGRRLLIDAALALVVVDTSRGGPHGRRRQDAHGLPPPVVGGGGAPRPERV